MFSNVSTIEEENDLDYSGHGLTDWLSCFGLFQPINSISSLCYPLFSLPSLPPSLAWVFSLYRAQWIFHITSSLCLSSYPPSPSLFAFFPCITPLLSPSLSIPSSEAEVTALTFPQHGCQTQLQHLSCFTLPHPHSPSLFSPPTSRSSLTCGG